MDIFGNWMYNPSFPESSPSWLFIFLRPDYSTACLFGNHEGKRGGAEILHSPSTSQSTTFYGIVLSVAHPDLPHYNRMSQWRVICVKSPPI